MTQKVLNVHLTRGLEGRDQHIDLLSNLFEESQVVTIETANPALDLISFTQDCLLFWVINAVNEPAQVEAPIEAPQAQDHNFLGLYPSFALERGSNYANGNGGSIYDDYCMGGDSRSRAENIAGFAYLAPSSAYPDPLHFQEHNIGIILRPQWRGQGVGEKALHYALDLAFSRSDVHRVQAQLIDCYKNDKALTLFTRMGFSHEGTRRQSFLCPLTQEWKDVTTLGLLVTDWLMHVRGAKLDSRSAPKSLWDALFSRHQQEREELLYWENKRPRRSSSLETIRERSGTPVQESSEAETDAETGSVVSGRDAKGKRKLFEIGDGKGARARDAYDASSSEYESDYESCVDTSPPKRVRSQQAESSIDGRGDFEIDWSTWRTTSGFIPDELDAPIPGLGLVMPAPKNSVISRPGLIPLPDSMDAAQNDAHTHDGDNWEDESPSPSPEPREGSVVSVPPSESESEDGYTSSSTNSLWEMVEGEDESRP